MREYTSKTLVCYQTGTGCTESVAMRIGKTLENEGLHADVRRMSERLDLAGYDAIVAGSSVRAGSWRPDAKRWMRHHTVVLKSKPLALFTVGIALADSAENAAEMLGYTDRMLEQTGLDPLDIGVFAGWFVPERFSWIERKIMQAKKSPVGDFRDFAAIERWATSVAHLLGSPAHAVVD